MSEFWQGFLAGVGGSVGVSLLTLWILCRGARLRHEWESLQNTPTEDNEELW